MDEFLPLQITAVAAMTLAFLASLRFLTRWLELRRSAAPHDLTQQLREIQARLDRIEQTGETTAVEVERIAEANRFIAQLLAERPTAALPRVSSPERVITPH